MKNKIKKIKPIWYYKSTWFERGYKEPLKLDTFEIKQDDTTCLVGLGEHCGAITFPLRRINDVSVMTNEWIQEYDLFFDNKEKLCEIINKEFKKRKDAKKREIVDQIANLQKELLDLGE